MAEAHPGRQGDQPAKRRLFELLRSHEFEAPDDEYWTPVEALAPRKQDAGTAAQAKPVAVAAPEPAKPRESTVLAEPFQEPPDAARPDEVPDYFLAASYDDFATGALESFVFQNESVAKLYPEHLRHWPERKPGPRPPMKPAA